MSEHHESGSESATEDMPLVEEYDVPLETEWFAGVPILNARATEPEPEPDALHDEDILFDIDSLPCIETPQAFPNSDSLSNSQESQAGEVFETCPDSDSLSTGADSLSVEVSETYPDSNFLSTNGESLSVQASETCPSSGFLSTNGESLSVQASETVSRDMTSVRSSVAAQSPPPVQNGARESYAPSVEAAERGGGNRGIRVGDDSAPWEIQLRFNAFIVLLLIAFIFGTFIASNNPQECTSIYPEVVYSPARAVQEFQPVRFDGDVRTTNAYKGPPSKELDKAWKDLYDVGPILVDKAKLKAIGKESIEVPSRPGKHLAKLAVFHQLHCLDYVRRYVHNEHYRIDDSHATVSAIEHADHCIDMIRQALSCSADPTLITFKQSSPIEPVEADFSATHACSNFDKVREWAKGNAINMTEEIIQNPEPYKNALIDSLTNQTKTHPNS
ncbi:hypothetical protein FQN49_001512 [Arthroderma sp. PD_2]|nr:hypothetical protein FQN49_001512 [Arthroderma sp. PD_2]